MFISGIVCFIGAAALLFAEDSVCMSRGKRVNWWLLVPAYALFALSGCCLGGVL